MHNSENFCISLYDLLISLTYAEEIISPEIANHHIKVAYTAYRLEETLRLTETEVKDLILASFMHDIGAFSFSERLALLEEDDTYMQEHAIRGAILVENAPYLHNASNIIRYHHLPWQMGAGAAMQGRPVPALSHLLHLADRIVIFINPHTHVLLQADAITEKISRMSGSAFIPAHTEAFMRLSTKESFWLDIEYKSLLDHLVDIFPYKSPDLNIDEVIELTKIFAHVIDFRNPFTAEHSSGVAAVAQALAAHLDFSKTECKMMFIAGNLHDLGKLALSEIIINKPGALSKEEAALIRSHTFYTYRILQSVKGFETITEWASYHHEKLNGKGYPFHLMSKELSLGSRVMAVADIFTALLEDRPYRRGMSSDNAKSILWSMVRDGSICKHVVSAAIEHFDEINMIRMHAQYSAKTVYRQVISKQTF